MVTKEILRKLAEDYGADADAFLDHFDEQHEGCYDIDEETVRVEAESFAEDERRVHDARTALVDAFNESANGSVVNIRTGEGQMGITISGTVAATITGLAAAAFELSRDSGQRLSAIVSTLNESISELDRRSQYSPADGGNGLLNHLDLNKVVKVHSTLVPEPEEEKYDTEE